MMKSSGVLGRGLRLTMVVNSGRHGARASASRDVVRRVGDSRGLHVRG